MEFNIADLFESLVDVIPERTAVVSGDRRLSYAELEARANRLANVLRSRGVGPGHHVGLHMFNGTEYIEGMLAAFKLRAVPININYRYVEDELRYLCDNGDLVAVLTQRVFADMVDRVVRTSGKAHTVIALADGSGGAMPSGALDYDAVLGEASAARDFGKRSGDDHFIIYTGGTTGMPKGVMWRHEDVFFAGLQGGNPGGAPIERPEELREKVAAGGVMPMRLLPAAPFIHGAAQWSAFICLFTGGQITLQPGKSFDPKRVVELIGQEKVSTLTLVGDAMARPIAELLASSEGTYDTSSLFVIASAGAVLSRAVHEQLKGVFPNAMIINSFGSTEGGHQGSAIPGMDQGREGRPSFMMDPATNVVFDEDFKPIVPGSGKIGWLARGGRVPLGYYKDEEKTAARFVTIDGKRWVLPGDQATVEADGRITVYGRGSGCINTGGEKVFPEEVEEALKSHPDVFDALVVGVDDERWMQRVAAVVEPRPGTNPTVDALQGHCREKIAGYKVPRQIVLVPSVMRFPSGKPDYTWAKSVVTGAV